MLLLVRSENHCDFNNDNAELSITYHLRMIARFLNYSVDPQPFDKMEPQRIHIW